MRKIRKKVIFAGLITLIALSAGCSTANSLLNVDYSGISQLTNTGNLEIVVICKSPKANKEKLKIENAVVKNLQNLGLFKNVYGTREGSNFTSDLRLEVTVTAIKPVSKSARFLIGAMAGQGKIEATIDLFDLVANKQVVWAKVAGTTSTGSALAGTTEEAINKLAEAIAKIFQEKAGKNSSLNQGEAKVQPVPITDLGENAPMN
ncbi:MAG: DUF4410 domain-containing protein [Candidatus Omnitrophota bacterium]